MKREPTEQDMQTRRRLIDELTTKGFERWDMDRDGSERFKRGDEMRTIRFNETLGAYTIK